MGADREADVARLVEALAEHTLGAFAGSDSACSCDHRWRTNAAYRRHQSDVLMPVVDAIARQRAAEELEAAVAALPCWCDVADDYGVSCPRHGTAAEELTDRAAALRGPHA